MPRLLMHRIFVSTPLLSKPTALRPKLYLPSELRHYAKSRPGPSFDAGKGPTAEEIFTKMKAQSKSQLNTGANIEAPPRQGLRKYGVQIGRLMLIPVLVYLGYRVYIWQTNPHRSIVLNGKYFTPFLLESKEKVSSTCSTFNLLSVPSGQNTANIDEAWRLGVWSVQVLQPQLQIARSYTPLPPTRNSPPEQISLVVRKELQGEVSSYLHRLETGNLVSLRGPHPEYRVPDDVDEVLFLAGGTGIAPALQVAHTLYTARGTPSERLPKMRILWANRRREDSLTTSKPSPFADLRASIVTKVRTGFNFDRTEKPPSKPKPLFEDENSTEVPKQSLLLEELEALRTRHDGKVQIDYFVDEEKTFITHNVLREHLSAKGTTPVQQDGPPRKKLLLISGPEGFISVLAGSKGMHAGKETQGSIGGFLEKIPHGGWEVWKL